MPKTTVVISRCVGTGTREKYKIYKDGFSESNILQLYIFSDCNIFTNK